MNSILTIICLFCAAGVSQARISSAVVTNWEHEYEELQQQLLDLDSKGPSGLRKSTSGESKMADPNALIWDSDGNPMDIALRRTASMKGSWPKQLKQTLSIGSASVAADISGTVGPRPFEYCVVTKVGRLRILASSSSL